MTLASYLDSLSTCNFGCSSALLVELWRVAYSPHCLLSRDPVSYPYSHVITGTGAQTVTQSLCIVHQLVLTQCIIYMFNPKPTNKVLYRWHATGYKRSLEAGSTECGSPHYNTQTTCTSLYWVYIHVYSSAATSADFIIYYFDFSSHPADNDRVR